MMNQKSVILLIGFLALISDAWILDLERAQRTLEEIDREETKAKGNGYTYVVCTYINSGNILLLSHENQLDFHIKYRLYLHYVVIIPSES